MSLPTPLWTALELPEERCSELELSSPMRGTFPPSTRSGLQIRWRIIIPSPAWVTSDNIEFPALLGRWFSHFIAQQLAPRLSAYCS